MHLYRCSRLFGLLKAQHLSIVKTSMLKGTNPKSRLSYSSLLLAVVSLSSILCFLDKGIEKNPGPPNKHCQAFDYESDTEKFAFLNLKKLVMSLIKVKSHLSFLNIFCENNVIPNGLMSDYTISVVRQSEDLDLKLKSLMNENSVKIIDSMVDYYKSIIEKWRLKKKN